MEIWK